MAEAKTEAKTVWYRNTVTGVCWEIEAGSALEKRLKVEFTDDADNPERRYEKLRSAPKSEDETTGQ